jgi:hypothetical protein
MLKVVHDETEANATTAGSSWNASAVRDWFGADR